jgi:hypothetical protein
MNIVLLAQQSLLRFATDLLGRMALPSKPMASATDSTKPTAVFAPKIIASHAVSTRAEGVFSLKSQVKPLRVVRVVETGQTRASVGRMVISGRMADVCAELDRLAACEAALT